MVVNLGPFVAAYTPCSDDYYGGTKAVTGKSGGGVQKKKWPHQQGQAIFEFIIFLPIMLMFYGVIVSLSSAINGSINQQKAIRGFTYGVMKGNPTIPPRILVQANLSKEGIGHQGMLVYLFGDRLSGGEFPRPYATCYRVPSFGQGESESCDDQLELSDNSSPVIRVKTAYGLCGATYRINSDKNNRIETDYFLSADKRGCLALKK